MSTYKQTEYMRKLVNHFGPDESRVCAAYADAERNGLVKRKSNVHDISEEEYARRLWRDGVNKGWLKQKSR